MCASIVILLVVVAAVLIWWLVRACEQERVDALHQAERVRIQRVQRQSEAQIYALTQTALQEMVKVASVHRPGCRCLRNERDLR